jgi:hypothetical protein
VFVEVNEPDVTIGGYNTGPFSVRPKSYADISPFGARNTDRSGSANVSFPLSRSLGEIKTPPSPSSGAVLSPTGRSLLYSANTSTFLGARFVELDVLPHLC